MTVVDGFTEVDYYTQVRVASAIASHWEDKIFDTYGEVWEIDFDRKFRFTAADATIPDKIVHSGFFSDAEQLELYIFSQFPKLAP
jgi:hypothetical protein